MRTKVLILVLMLSSVFVFVPAAASAATGNAAESPQIRVQVRRKHYNRGRHRGWYNGRRAYWYSYNPRDVRYVRRVQYINGRRIVRWYWNY